MSYTAISTELPGVLILEPRVFDDPRGFFFESYNHQDFITATGLDVQFVQDNHSSSFRGVLRGLHYQLEYPQGKLVRVIRGSVFDVAVDIRRSSPNFGKWVGIDLSADNKRQLWIPAGFAHGFLATSEVAELAYKTSDYWRPHDEHTLLWRDPAIGIDWPLMGPPLLASKDEAGNDLSSSCLFI